jgi:hypothetical protein
VQVGAPIEIGGTPGGCRRVIPIIGGTVSGPGLQGRVLAAGADFQLVHPANGTARLDARYVLALDDGTHVFVVNRALRRSSPEVTERLMRGVAVDPALQRCPPQDIGQAKLMCLRSGSSRMRFPVAWKIALASAGAAGGTPISPTPRIESPLSSTLTTI